MAVIKARKPKKSKTPAHQNLRPVTRRAMVMGIGAGAVGSGLAGATFRRINGLEGKALRTARLAGVKRSLLSGVLAGTLAHAATSSTAMHLYRKLGGKERKR